MQNPLLPTTTPNATEHNQRLSSKLVVRGSITWESFRVFGELGDSRVYLDNSDSTLGSGEVNTLEPTQFNISWLRPQTTSPSEINDLDHKAFLVHASLGKNITATEILMAVVDVVSGDNDAKDNKSNDFDSLSGVRRFDYGPTDVYQSFPRRNLVGIGAAYMFKGDALKQGNFQDNTTYAYTGFNYKF